nr:cysteine-rich receptor-like protein kinase 6 [Quercus suber]
MASTDLTKLCPEAREAVIWEELCEVRYSYKDFYDQYMSNVTGHLFTQINMMNISEPEQYRSIVNDTLGDLTKQAAFGSLANMYATGEVPFIDRTIYALVQCSGNLSAENCNSCLHIAITEILTCCYSAIGARVMSTSCYLRYEVYPFYGDAPAPPKNLIAGSGERKKWMIIILTIVSVCLAIALFGYCVYCHVKNKRTQKRRKDMEDQESTNISLTSICEATDNFSESNKLGQGGFGSVYKGILSDGKVVAVKRLSKSSEQGLREFTTEVQLIMKLQHKNLVRLWGFCVKGDEKLLVYEYMPNNSLDVFLFDPKKRVQLNWSRRLSIISGIARGVLYLHEDSRLRVIHRDLKASNVLLDYDMNPKISDFGMARIFEGNESESITGLIVGTDGYIAPEYAMEGLYSVKSDVFSFGVLLLEIISGRRNGGSNWSNQGPGLLTCAWQSWNEGKVLELMDPLLTDSCDPEEFLRHVHIGLLCVQEDASHRPTMSSVVLMLNRQTVTLRPPQRPAFSGGRFSDYKETNVICSVNAVTISSILPR